MNYDPVPGRSNRPSHTHSLLKKSAVFILCGALFGASAALAYEGVSSLDLFSSTETQSSTTIQSASQSSTIQNTVAVSDSTQNSQSLDVSDVASSVMPAMVSITNISVTEVENYMGMFGRSQIQTQESESCGSGIIIGENESELLIATNNHVVEDSTTLSVCFIDDSVAEATIKGTDSGNDLAVVAVKLEDLSEDTKNSIRKAVLGDSTSLQVGEQVVAIGNALGYGQSVTTGIVSALNRQIDSTDAIMIQTDAAINPGNSGGALVNMNGEVIGINSAKFSSTEVEGMGYAISISDALPIIENLKSQTTREKVSDDDASYLGISGEDITSSMEAEYGIPQGIYITSVAIGSAADQAGLSVKSVLTYFDGTRITSLSSLKNRLEYYAAGETVEIIVQDYQNGEYTEKTLQITLGSAAQENSRNARSFGWGFPSESSSQQETV